MKSSISSTSREFSWSDCESRDFFFHLRRAFTAFRTPPSLILSLEALAIAAAAKIVKLMLGCGRWEVVSVSCAQFSISEQLN